MKRVYIVLVVLFAFSCSVAAQVGGGTAEKEIIKPEPMVVLGIGFVPNKDYNALRASLAWNNISDSRFGIYNALEKGVDSKYFSHILGVTYSPVHFMTLNFGIDWFTKYGIIQAGKGCRKDFGVYLYPYKWTMVKVGYSFTVGVIAEVGIAIPLP